MPAVQKNYLLQTRAWRGPDGAEDVACTGIVLEESREHRPTLQPVLRCDQRGAPILTHAVADGPGRSAHITR